MRSNNTSSTTSYTRVRMPPYTIRVPDWNAWSRVSSMIDGISLAIISWALHLASAAISSWISVRVTAGKRFESWLPSPSYLARLTRPLQSYLSQNRLCQCSVKLPMGLKWRSSRVWHLAARCQTKNCGGVVECIMPSGSLQGLTTAGQERVECSCVDKALLKAVFHEKKEKARPRSEDRLNWF